MGRPDRAHPLPGRTTAVVPHLRSRKTTPGSGAELNVDPFPIEDDEIASFAAFGQAGTAAALLEAGADVEARDTTGQTAIVAAGGYGYTDVVDVLLRYGADPNARDDTGRTALLEGGAAPDGHPERLSPLYYAAEAGHLAEGESSSGRVGPAAMRVAVRRAQQCGGAVELDHADPSAASVAPPGTSSPTPNVAVEVPPRASPPGPPHAAIARST